MRFNLPPPDTTSRRGGWVAPDAPRACWVPGERHWTQCVGLSVLIKCSSTTVNGELTLSGPDMLFVGTVVGGTEHQERALANRGCQASFLIATTIWFVGNG